ncbi:MAG: Maf family protein [Defluviitaleaceae bacterium]|nr:Maf family protein [Defluviitaleaceae bacterium]
MKLILASGSPRRQQLLTLAGIPFQVIVSDADETIDGHPAYQVETLALRKAHAVKPTAPEDAIILAADTLVYIDGQVLGKPAGPEEAFAMLQKLQGRQHTVYTGVALLHSGGETSFVDATQVFFRPLSGDEINDYIATGEPFDKAGAYGIQERGATLVDRVDGDFYTVVGLPIAKVWAALRGIAKSN